MSGCYLTDDAIFLILVRLPVKALCKFRCVSKSWHALISDPFFLESHQKQSKQNPLLLINSECSRKLGNARLTSLDPQGNVVSKFVKSLEYEGSTTSRFTCLDLVCMHESIYMYLCNPATGEVFVVPEQSSRYYGTFYIHALGFEYLPGSNEYKVLVVFNLNDVAIDHLPDLVCEVFTIRKEGTRLRVVDEDTCCWREVERPPFVDIGRDQAVVNGAFHVVPYNEYDPDGRYKYHDIQDGIGRFDLVREEWSMLPPPSELSVVSHSVCLGETGGLLFLADLVNNWQYIDIWMLMEYHSVSWVKKYRIDVSVVSSWTPSSWLRVIPRTVMQDGRILLEHERTSLQYYDPRAKTVELINVPSAVSMTTSMYVESLASFVA